MDALPAGAAPLNAVVVALQQVEGVVDLGEGESVGEGLKRSLERLGGGEQGCMDIDGCLGDEEIGDEDCAVCITCGRLVGMKGKTRKEWMDGRGGKAVCGSCGGNSYLLLPQPGGQGPPDEECFWRDTPCLAHLRGAPWEFVREVL